MLRLLEFEATFYGKTGAKGKKKEVWKQIPDNIMQHHVCSLVKCGWIMEAAWAA